MSIIAPRSTDAFFKAPREFAKRGANGFPIGPRTEKRQAMNKELNKLPDSVKKVCELRIPGVCIGNRMLTWAHSHKSRFLCTDKLWKEAARACLACHQAVESLSHSEMKRLICEAIAGRKP
jgi:hypothetical protein